MTKVKREKSFAVFADFQQNAKVFPLNLLSNSTFKTDKARTAKVFPTLIEIQRTAKLFSRLSFIVDSIL